MATATATATDSLMRTVTIDENGNEVIDILEPRDADVLCGRGGAALRHPGNQTYRRLVHLNKGLYITCLKAEKLKISRSIVTAIREQDGRFLERDTVRGTWYDIGDKKATEKTSQALREGQPKLRQKIVELGGGVAGAAALMENRFPSAAAAPAGAGHSREGNTSPALYAMSAGQQQHQQAMTHHSHGMTSNSNQRDFGNHGLMQRMADMEMDATPTIQEESASFHDSMSSQQFNSAAADLQPPALLPFASGFSAMSEYSSFGMPNSDIPPPPNHMSSPANSLLMSPGNFSNISTSYSGNNMTSTGNTHGGGDRRNHFAHMKYSRPQSGRSAASGASGGSYRQQQQTGHYNYSNNASNKQLYASNRSIMTDSSMLEFHPVESNQSLFSHRYPSLVDQTNVATTTTTSGRHAIPEQVVAAHPVFESRRSIMSGMSRISDASDMHSIFSDLSRKIGNVSTRSFAMSEISVMDEQERTMEYDGGVTFDLSARPSLTPSLTPPPPPTSTPRSECSSIPSHYF